MWYVAAGRAMPEKGSRGLAPSACTNLGPPYLCVAQQQLCARPSPLSLFLCLLVVMQLRSKAKQYLAKQEFAEAVRPSSSLTSWHQP